MSRTVTVFTGYANQSSNTTIAAGGVSVRYQQASVVDTPDSTVIENPSITLDLMPSVKGSIAPGSLCFKLGDYTYVDRAGVLYHSVNPATGSGTPAGSVNYLTGQVTITSWAGSSTFTLVAGLINPMKPGMAHSIGRTAARPIKSQSFTISCTALDGTQISVTSDVDGLLNSANTRGYVNADTGVYVIFFGHDDNGTWISKLIDPSTMRYNAVAYSYLPLDASVIGLDPVRLPQDGRVPIFRLGDFAVIGHTAVIGPVTVSNGQTINCSRVRLSRVRVIDHDNHIINLGYTQDLEAGTVTFNDVTGYVQPITIEHRVEDMVQVSDVQISGQLTFTREVTHAYPTGSSVSSALIAGDLYAHVEKLFDQGTWGSTWSDTIVGSPATGTYNAALAPIEVTNAGCSNERWALVFANTTQFSIIGEHVGVIGTGSPSTDTAPINPATGVPYFTLKALGWGSGWSAGNVLRFNTVGALFPVWVVRTIQQGLETVQSDSFSLLVRGDVDAN